MSLERHGGLRAHLATLAAAIMYEEGVKQYFTAKRLAAKRALGSGSTKRARARPRDLPSNGEIRAALLELAELLEGDTRTRRLFAMRIVALEAMLALEAFSPRLIGSVATGHVRAGSDVDLHVFAEHPLEVVAAVTRLGWTHDVQHVSLVKHGVPREYVHVHVEDVFPLELTVYAPRELRIRPRSSTDGRPIERVGVAALRALCARDHATSWARYLEHGVVPSLETILLPHEDDDEAG
jgi:hypothetical protein